MSSSFAASSAKYSSAKYSCPLKSFMSSTFGLKSLIMLFTCCSRCTRCLGCGVVPLGGLLL
eukprot:3513551-Amphidinium_carterae.1